MKKILLILTFVVLLTSLLFVFTQKDDDLNEAVTDLIGLIDTGADSRSFLYLYGIYAHETEDPVALGKKRLTEFEKAEADSDYVQVAYDQSRKLALPEGEYFCPIWEEGCLNTLFSSNTQATQLLEQHRVLISRVNTFLGFNEYTILTKPSHVEELPPYEYVSAAERIKVLNAIEVYKKGEPEQAVKLLQAQFLQLRKALMLPGSLVGKFVILMKLNEIINVYSVILFQESMTTEKLPLLTLAEKDFGMAAAREFALMYKLYKELDKQANFFKGDGNVPAWLVRAVYKPNMSLNAISPVYQRLESLARLSLSDFAKEVDVPLTISNSKLRNMYGASLSRYVPNYDKYVGRLMDFDAKLMLFNHTFASGEPATSFVNPYYEKGFAIEKGKRVCFAGPLDDTRHIRCLRLKI